MKEAKRQNPLVERAEPARTSERVYRPPCILWEQEFVALATGSIQPCDPASDPTCPRFGPGGPFQ